MGFFRKIGAIIFGSAKDEPHESNEEEDDTTHVDHHHQQQSHQPQQPPQSQQHPQQHPQQYPRGEETTRRKGFSVKVPVAVDRAPLGPIIIPCNLGDGGVQGLKWYAKSLRIDEDGDVADEFLNEVFPEVVEMPSGVHDRKPLPNFELKYNTRPIRFRKQMLSLDGGNVYQSIEHQGKLQWV